MAIWNEGAAHAIVTRYENGQISSEIILIVPWLIPRKIVKYAPSRLDGLGCGDCDVVYEEDCCALWTLLCWAFCAGCFFEANLNMSLVCVLIDAKNHIKNFLRLCSERLQMCPLREKVNFKTVLQKGNRIQLPKLVRWRFKVESFQVLKIMVTPARVFGFWENFYA